jgi:hypothetical protein
VAGGVARGHVVNRIGGHAPLPDVALLGEFGEDPIIVILDFAEVAAGPRNLTPERCRRMLRGTIV